MKKHGAAANCLYWKIKNSHGWSYDFLFWRFDHFFKQKKLCNKLLFNTLIDHNDRKQERSIILVKNSSKQLNIR
jgi:hypothetical protein